MPFSFNPGQEQSGGAQVAPGTPQLNNGVPVLQVPTIPSIAIGGNAPVEEKLSPFAFRNRNKSKFGIYFQSVIFLVFGSAVVTIIGLFVYKTILQSEIKSKQEALAIKEDSFPKLPLTDMQKLSNRLKLVNKVIKEHSSARTAFQILEDSVEDPIVYTKFSLSQNKTKGGYTLELAAEAPNYHTIYQQMEALKLKKYASYLSPIVMTGISLDKNGIATFKLSTNIALEGVLPESLTFSSSTPVVASTSSQVILGATTTDVNGQVVPTPTLIGGPQ